MKVLIIGGNRFFGKRLVHLLLQQRHEVAVLNRGQTPDDFGDRVRRITCDRRELRKDHPALKDWHWDVVYDQVCFDATEARAACETCQGRIGKMIFTSTQSVYDSGSWLKESDFNPKSYKFQEIVPREKSYQEAKRQAEAVFFSRATFPVTAVRFPIVLGMDDYTERLKIHVQRIREGKPIYFPNLDAKMCFVQSADAAAFLATLLERDFTGPINCCSPEPLALRQIVSAIEEVVGKKAVLAAAASDDNHSPFGIEKDWFMDTSELRRIGFTPTPLHDWLPALITSLNTTLNAPMEH